MSEIAQKVKQIIIDKLGVEESEVTPEASFTNDDLFYFLCDFRHVILV